MRIDSFSIRELSAEDLSLLLSWRNMEKVKKYMFTDHQITQAEHLKWYERVISSDNTSCHILIFEQRPVGFFSFNNIDLINQTCTWGFYLGEAGLPIGTGLVMGYLAMEYAFSELGLRKICGQVLEDNSRSLRLFNRLGFTEEGCLKEQIHKCDLYKNVKLLALFNSKWQDHKHHVRQTLEDLR